MYGSEPSINEGSLRGMPVSEIASWSVSVSNRMFWLEVAMNHPVGVELRDLGCQADRERQEFADRHRCADEPLERGVMVGGSDGNAVTCGLHRLHENGARSMR
jgi:hypothetical protein